jgi:hypothetical protein
VVSLNLASVNVAISNDDGKTFSQTPVQGGLPLDDREWIAAYGADTSPPNPLASAGVLNVSAWAGHGRASVADVKLAKAGLSASAITAKCENNNGVSQLTRAVLAGHKLAVDARPNSTITVPVQGLGSVSVVPNKQVRNGPTGAPGTTIRPGWTAVRPRSGKSSAG